MPLDNPFALIKNDGAGNFSADLSAFSAADQQRHRLSVEHGLAAGDLDKDGFVDMVSVAASEAPPATPPPTLFPNPFALAFGGPWDPEALIGTAFPANAATPGTFDFVPEFLSYPNGSCLSK